MLSNYTNFSWRKVVKFLDESPKMEAALEIIFSTFVSFLPFLLLALAKSTSSGEIPTLFFSFFTAGEMVIFVFTTCATILWIAFIKGLGFTNKIVKVLLIVAVVGGLAFCGMIIADNVGFKKEISDFDQLKILIAFVLSLLFWFAISVSSAGESKIVDETKIIDEKYLNRDRQP